MNINKKKILIGIISGVLMLSVSAGLVYGISVQQQKSLAVSDSGSTDYFKYVSGLRDLQVDKNGTLKPLEGVVWDKEVIRDVRPDATKVNLKSDGTYPLTYFIYVKGRDLVLKKTVDVVVGNQHIADGKEPTNSPTGGNHSVPAKLPDVPKPVEDVGKDFKEEDKNTSTGSNNSNTNNSTGSNSNSNNGSNNNSGNTSSNSGSSNNNSGNSGGSTSKPDPTPTPEPKPEPPAHVHDWVQDKEWGIVKDGWDETVKEQVPVDNWCTACQRDLGPISSEEEAKHVKNHMLNGENVNIIQGFIEVDKVIHHDPEYGWIMKNSWTCSGCGAKK